MLETIQCLLLLIIANGAPIVFRNLMGDRFNYSLDGGYLFVDGKPLLGSSKTLRGLVSAIVCTALVAWLMGLGLMIGAAFGFFSMLGDSLSSFIKRRLSLQPSDRLLGFDQIPEALLPLVILHNTLELGWAEITIIVCSFIVIELLLSRVLYKMKIRNRPY
jgi:CDP-2,3-bis-(O-geranylgeranyl)-sn-glycerol synthase